MPAIRSVLVAALCLGCSAACGKDSEPRKELVSEQHVDTTQLSEVDLRVLGMT